MGKKNTRYFSGEKKSLTNIYTRIHARAPTLTYQVSFNVKSQSWTLLSINSVIDTGKLNANHIVTSVRESFLYHVYSVVSQLAGEKMLGQRLRMMNVLRFVSIWCKKEKGCKNVLPFTSLCSLRLFKKINTFNHGSENHSLIITIWLETKERGRKEGWSAKCATYFFRMKKNTAQVVTKFILRLDSSPCTMRSGEMFWAFAYLICFNKFHSNWNTVGVEILHNHLRRSDYCWSSSALARSEGHKRLSLKEAQTVRNPRFQRDRIGSLSAYSK